MQYLTAEQLATRLTSDASFGQPLDADYTALLEQACTNATAIINAYLGDGRPFAFEELGTLAAPVARTFTGDGTITLQLDMPLQQLVTTNNGGVLHLPADLWLEPINAAHKTSLVIKPAADGSQYGWDTARNSVVVSGVWGWGKPPAEIVEATAEIAVRIVKGRAAGYSDVIGVNPDGTQQYVKALPPLVKLALDLAKKQYQIAAVIAGDFGAFGVA